ncbi:hypothetical protein GCM10022229_04810 [Luteimonas lutimaris]|uniref:Lipoprotein n=2 Tax=Luteimonas lutimaris TaxID=698645 RepID=A0ABP7M4C4_9GAMM
MSPWAPLRAMLVAGALLSSGCSDPFPASADPPRDGDGMATALGVQYRHLTSPEMATMATRCETASVLARSFDDWIAAVHSAGMHREYVDELIDAHIRAAVIRTRCTPVPLAPRPGTRAAERERRR